MSKYFQDDVVAARYDSVVEGSIPFYRVCLEWVAEMVARLGQEPLSILDVGCGTGSVSAAVLQRNPDIKHMCLIDISAAMLAIAAQRVEGLAKGRTAIDTKIVDINALDGATLQPQGFNVILDVMALSHVDNYDSVKTVLAQLRELSVDDGLLIVSEKCIAHASERECHFRSMINVRSDILRERGLMSMESIDAWRKHVLHEDSAYSLAEWCDFAFQAGWQVVDLAGVPLGPESATREGFETKQTIVQLDHKAITGAARLAQGLGIVVCKAR